MIVGPRAHCHSGGLVAERRNLLLDDEALPSRVMAQVRYRHRPVPATVTLEGDDRFALHFDDPQFAVTVGQSAVLYDGDRLLGGGVIRERRQQTVA